MGHAASHHRKSSWPKPCGLMIGHLREDGAANDDQLLFGHMKVPRNHASRGAFNSSVERPVIGSPVSIAEDRHFTSLSGENWTDDSGLMVPVAIPSARATPQMQTATHAASSRLIPCFILHS